MPADITSFEIRLIAEASRDIAQTLSTIADHLAGIGEQLAEDNRLTISVLATIRDGLQADREVREELRSAGP